MADHTATHRFSDVRLYVLITEALCARPWRDTMRAAAAGGATCFQLREKHLSGDDLRRRCDEFRSVCHELGALCIINDHPHMAADCRADGVHVGQDDADVAAARHVVGADGIVGVSTHSLEQVRDAAHKLPDYIAVGPMYATDLKSEYQVAGVNLLIEAQKATTLPLVAIGGIAAQTVAPLIEAGCRCAAVCTNVISADDPQRAAAAIARLFETV